MGTGWDIWIRNRRHPQDARKKTLALPSKRGETLSRRKSGQVITFYDCASVKDGLGWRDHPILKVPGYAISTAAGDLGALYTIDGWTGADYQDYQDLLFEIPVAEWKDNYKKLEYEENFYLSNAGAPAHYPTNLKLRYAPQTGVILRKDVFFDLGADLDDGTAQRDLLMSLYNCAFDRKGLEYREFTEINYRCDPSNVGSRSGAGNEWFSCSTVLKDLFEYKVTATLDPDAADVGDIVITGNIDVYLIPEIGLFMGASYNGTNPFVLDGHDGVQVIGPWYQVLPRDNWPMYEDPYLLADQELLKAAYLDYQKNRADAIASEWATNMVGVVVSASLDPLDFSDGNVSWKTTFENGGPTFYGGSAGTYTNSIDYNSDDPVLMAVLKIHGQFYYVWSGDTDDPGFNTATNETSAVTGYEAIVIPNDDWVGIP